MLLRSADRKYFTVVFKGQTIGSIYPMANGKWAAWKLSEKVGEFETQEEAVKELEKLNE